MSKKNIRSHLGSHKLAAFQHPSNPKNPEKCSSPAPCSFGLPLHFSALKSLLIHRVLHGCLHGLGPAEAAYRAAAAGELQYACGTCGKTQSKPGWS